MLISSALISGSEVALFSLTKKQIEDNLNFSSLKTIQRLLLKPNKLLATILITNNLINIAIVILFSSIGNDLFYEISSPLLKFIFEIVVATLLILFFGEILPKIYASRNNIKFSKMISGILNFLDFFFSPISIPMQKFSSYINSKVKIKSAALNIDEISYALEMTDSNLKSNEQKKLLKGIVSFGNNVTKNIMQEKSKIFALEKRLNFNDLIKKISENKYSRIPIYQNNIDNIIGVLHVKDLLPFLNKIDHNWIELLRSPFYISENKNLDELILEFQSKRIHLAIVLDQKNEKTVGVVSLEDVVEEIVGDISDEFDGDKND